MNKFLYGGAGAETVMFRTTELLRSCGHEVSYFSMRDSRNLPSTEAPYFAPGRYYDTRHSTFRRAKDAGASIYSFQARKALRRLLARTRPDVAHLHNVYHQLTMSIVDELTVQKVPIVMTLHDYKPVCPSYVLYTDHAPCHRCVRGNPFNAVLHRCVKDSRAASTIAATEALLVRARGSYDKIDAFISPSRYLANIMVEGGHARGRIHTIPNFVADEQFAAPGMRKHNDPPTVLFVGRLEEVKGIRILLAAAEKLRGAGEVVLVGDGSLRPEVEDAHAGGAVRYLGSRTWDDIARLMDSATALLIPSLWEENCPMVVLEAGARGCPVIGSNHGGLPEMISDGEDGFLVPAGDVDALVSAIRRLASDPDLARQLGEARHARTLAHNVSGAYLASVLDVYETVQKT